MSNSIIPLKQIARETLPILIDNLVFPNLINHVEGEVTHNTNGKLSKPIAKAVVLEAKDYDWVDDQVIQDITEESVDIELNKLATVDVELRDTQPCDEETIRRVFIEPAAIALAEKINRDVYNLYKEVPNIIQLPADATGEDILGEVAYLMDINKAPVTDRYAVFNPGTAKDIRKMSNLTPVSNPHALGKAFGFETYMSQGVTHHTAGGAAEALADGSITLTVETIRDNDESRVFMTLKASESINMKGVVTGDILQIGGENYIVMEDNIAFGSSLDVVLDRVFTGSEGDTVTIIPSHDANLVFHPNAFAFATHPLAKPVGVESYVTTYNGISLRVTRGYDIRKKKELLSMDVLYGYKVVHPELAYRVCKESADDATETTES